MKKSLLLALSALAVTLSAQAAGPTTATQSFTVSAQLEAQCRTKSGQNPDVNFGTYTAFGSASTAAPTANIVFECSRGMTKPTAAIDTASGTLMGVDFTLSVNAGSKTVTGTGAGNSDEYTYVVTGGMTSGQAGDASSSTTQVTRNLTISF